ncbi:MAG TPA: molybdate ABC transporter substrate-binding protein [Planctomycetota bacterium]|nr:molybdate ABC transporter substrate-binding protein [Planctomycetota bacterium]
MRRLVPGRISSVFLAFLGSAVLLAALIALLRKPSAQSSRTPLTVYCAAGLKAPLEAAAKGYEQESGVPIQFNFGASQTLLANLETARRGDLYIPADDSYVDMAQKKDLIAERVPLARMSLILCVKKGNPKNVNSIADLLKPEIKLSQANPDAAASGSRTRQALQKSGQWEEIKARTTVFKGTVNDVAADVKLGAVDAGFIWDAMLKQYPDLEAVKTPELEGSVANIAVAVLKSSTDLAAATRFARYLAALDKGLKEFERNGYTPAEGRTWSAQEAGK